MKKAILIILFLIIVVLAGGVYYVLTNLDSLVKEAIEQFGSQATQTRVEVQRVNIHLKKASAAISGLTVANPSGFSMPNAFSLGEISTRLDLKATNKTNIAIDEIKVLSPQIFYEVNADKKANLNLLKDRLSGGKKGTASKTSSGGSAEMPNLSIHKFVFSGAAVHALLVPLKDKQYDLTLPAFTLSNLHGTPDQISRQVLNQLIDRARDEIRRKGIDAELEKAKAQVKAKVDAEKAKAKEKVDSRVQEEKSKAQDKLKNLLGN